MLAGVYHLRRPGGLLSWFVLWRGPLLQPRVCCASSVFLELYLVHPWLIDMSARVTGAVSVRMGAVCRYQCAKTQPSLLALEKRSAAVRSFPCLLNEIASLTTLVAAPGNTCYRDTFGNPSCFELCLDPGYVPCEAALFCCPLGYNCFLDALGRASCAP